MAAGANPRCVNQWVALFQRGCFQSWAILHNCIQVRLVRNMFKHRFVHELIKIPLWTWYFDWGRWECRSSEWRVYVSCWEFPLPPRKLFVDWSWAWLRFIVIWDLSVTVCRYVMNFNIKVVEISFWYCCQWLIIIKAEVRLVCFWRFLKIWISSFIIWNGFCVR